MYFCLQSQEAPALAGRGYDDPTVPPTDFVELFVKTKVLDWGSANQSSVVE